MSENTPHINDQLKVGRPLFDGKDESTVLQKLEEAFTCGANDEEACILADISPSALYAYQKKHKGFLERKRVLKNLPSLQAKRTIVQRLSDDVELAKWWLTRKLPEEFGVRRLVPAMNAPSIEIDLLGEAEKRVKKWEEIDDSEDT